MPKRTSEAEITFLTVRLPRKELDRMRKAADAEQRPVSNWARLRLREALDAREE